jgi:hypothetical protein
MREPIKSAACSLSPELGHEISGSGGAVEMSIGHAAGSGGEGVADGASPVGEGLEDFAGLAADRGASEVFITRTVVDETPEDDAVAPQFLERPVEDILARSP